MKGSGHFNIEEPCGYFLFYGQSALKSCVEGYTTLDMVHELSTMTKII